jgi:hypothetical protein
MQREEFFDLRIATLEPHEEAPSDAQWVRIEEPGRRQLQERLGLGWFYKPCFVTYVLEIPPTLDAYIERSFRTGTRNKPRKLLRQVPLRYRLEIAPGERGIGEFTALYRRTIVARPRGRDRVSEHRDGFGPDWTGFYLYDQDQMVAGILVHATRRHRSVAYGAFDPACRELDLEHFLIMQAIGRCAEEGVPTLSLGMDTNRYGHHLPLGLPAYKLRIGFTPLAYEPAGRELVKIQSFEPFEEGLFFYTYGSAGIVGNLFTRGEPDLRPFRHHNAPPILTHRFG